MKPACRKTGRAFIGTSGWNYRHWADGVFYPPSCKPAEWLEFYASVFEAVEINNTFYHLPPPHVFKDWHDRTPADFTFAVKASRFITHMKKLAEPELHVARFLSHAAELRGKLGVVLFQLPPFWKLNASRLEGLLDFMATQTIVPQPRVALEVRHPSWRCEECFEILRRHHAALAFSDWPGCSTEEPLTGGFGYLRRHGPAIPGSAAYPNAMLRHDAFRVRRWLAEGRDVHAYFNNDAGGHAVRDARRLRERLLHPGSP